MAAKRKSVLCAWAFQLLALLAFLAAGVSASWAKADFGPKNAPGEIFCETLESTCEIVAQVAGTHWKTPVADPENASGFTYNLEVEDHHNYFVGNESVLLHNAYGEYLVGAHGTQPRPRGIFQSHHIIQNEWAVANVSKYNPNTAITILLRRGTFDTTKLRNGIYEIRLVASDLAGRTYASPSRKVVVEGGMKVGHFTVAFNDLTVKMPGLDLTVARSYDSRDKCSGDFGVGWNLDLNTVKLEKSHPIMRNWKGTVYPPGFQIGTMPVYYIEDAGPHVVTITFPDGKVERFQPYIEIVDKIVTPGLGDRTPSNAQLGAPPSNDARLRMLFKPASGTHGKLSMKGIPGYFYYADTFLGDRYFGAEPEAWDLLREPTGFTYTSQDGRTFNFDANGKLLSMSDRVGNTLTITNTGVYHSSGKAITWQRDTAGRITTVTDPKGYTLHYTYDPLGDLREFYDREAEFPGSPTVQFKYQPDHDLEEILDAKGRRAAKNIYDNDNRLIRSIDVAGKETVFTHEIEGKTETITSRDGSVTVHRYDERGNITQTSQTVSGRTQTTN